MTTKQKDCVKSKGNTMLIISIVKLFLLLKRLSVYFCSNKYKRKTMADGKRDVEIGKVNNHLYLVCCSRSVMTKRKTQRISRMKSCKKLFNVINDLVYWDVVTL